MYFIFPPRLSHHFLVWYFAQNPPYLKTLEFAHLLLRSFKDLINKNLENPLTMQFSSYNLDPPAFCSSLIIENTFDIIKSHKII